MSNPLQYDSVEAFQADMATRRAKLEPQTERISLDDLKAGKLPTVPGIVKGVVVGAGAVAALGGTKSQITTMGLVGAASGMMLDDSKPTSTPAEPMSEYEEPFHIPPSHELRKLTDNEQEMLRDAAKVRKTRTTKHAKYTLWWMPFTGLIVWLYYWLYTYVTTN